VVGDRVATRREIIVGSVLILIRASLIALARSLVVIRPRLILITRRLVAITCPLLPITQRAVTHLINRTGCDLGAAGRAPRNLCRFAAGWTLHNLHGAPRLQPVAISRKSDGLKKRRNTREALPCMLACIYRARDLSGTTSFIRPPRE
jgi:hypothetical protein